MASVTVSQFLRRLGEPSIEVDPNTGLRRITRNYVVDITGIEVANFDAYVQEELGNTDREYTNAYLIDQKVVGGENEQGPVLSRVFQELGDPDLGTTPLVQYGTDDIERLENNLYRITRVFIGLAGSAEDTAILDDAVGVETYNPGNPAATTYLFGWKREPIGKTLVRYTKVYQEPGVIRVDINEKFKGKLIEYTVTGFLIDDTDVTVAMLGDPYNDGTTKPPLYDIATENYEGFTTVRLRYVYGEGVISIDRSKKSGANVIDEVTIVSVNVTPAEAITDGYTYTFDPGGPDELVINTAWLALAGLNSISTDTRDNYIVYTARYISLDNAAGYVGGGGGTIDGGTLVINSGWEDFVIPADSILSDQNSTAYGGNVLVRNISFITDATLLESDPNYKSLDNLIGAVATGGYIVTAVKVTIYPGYAVGEFTMAKGSGVVSVSKDNRFADVRPGFEGGLVYQVQAINISPLEAGAFDQGGVIYDFTTGYKVIKSDVKDTEYGPLYTMELFGGSAITGLTQSTRYDGSLTLTTITGLNLNPLDYYGDQYGTPVEDETSVNEYGVLHKYTFTQGQGVFETRTETRYNGALTLVTVKSLNEAPVIPDGVATISNEVASDRWGDVFTVVYVYGSGEISRRTDNRFGGNLKIITVQTINEQPAVPEDAAIMSSSIEDGSYGQVYTIKYAEGTGLLGTELEYRYNEVITIATERWLNTQRVGDLPIFAKMLSSTTAIEDYGTLFTYRYAYGSGVVETSDVEKFFNSETGENVLDIRTITSVNVAPSAPTGYILVQTKTEERDVGTFYIYEYAKGSGVISTSTSDRLLNYLGQPVVQAMVVTTLNYIPTLEELGLPATARLATTKQETGDYGITYTFTYVYGNGIVSRSETRPYPSNQSIIVYDERWANQPPSYSGRLISQSVDETDFTTFYSVRYVVGSGQISKSTTYLYEEKLTVYRTRFLEEYPSDSGVDGDITDIDVQAGSYGNEVTVTSVAGGGTFHDSQIEIVDGVTEYNIRAIRRYPSLTLKGQVVNEDVSSTPYGPLYSVTTVRSVKDTVISENYSTGPDGATYKTKTVVGDGAKDIAAPENGYFLIESASQDLRGWTKTTLRFYKPPEDYTLEYEETIFWPGKAQAAATVVGYTPVRLPALRNVSGIKAVQFTSSPPSAIDAREALRATSYLNLSYSGAEDSENRVVTLDGWFSSAEDNSATSDAYQLGNGAIVDLNSTIVGPVEPTGSFLYARQVEPAYAAAGIIFYKVTTTTLAL